MLDAQPPIITPYTPNETTPNTYNTPTLISATCKETCLPNKNKSCPQGITAVVIQAVNILSDGPSTNKNVLACVGIISSLVNNFTPSASGCNKPQGPALLGPTRSWKNPANFLSARVVYIAITKLIPKMAEIKINFSIINAISIFI